jgi:ATP-dependent Clp protease ATP-binding subunit ClpA
VAQLRQSGKPVRIQQLIPTSKVKQVIEKAFEAAAEEQSPVVDTGHMLIGLFATDDPIASPVLAEKGATRERAKGALARLRQQGVSDAVKADVTGSPTRRHLALTDRRGRPIGIEIVFPAGYSSEDQDTLALRIHEAVGKGGTE